MRITELSITGLMGDWQTHDYLTPLTILSAPNFSGKTRRLQGIQFAVEGVTSAGGRNEDTATLCAPNGCMASIMLDDGFGWHRRMKRKGDGWTQDVEITGRGVMGIREADPIVREKVGNFAPSFDLAAFTGLSADKQRDFVLDLCAKASGNPVNADAVCAKITLAMLEAHEAVGSAAVNLLRRDSQADDAIIGKLWPTLPERFRECCTSIMCKVQAEIRGELTQSIGAALDKCKALKNAAKADKDRCEAASVKTAERKNAIQVPAQTVGAMQEERKGLAVERDKVVAQIGHQEGRAAARKRIAERKDALAITIEESEEVLSSMESAADAIAKADAAQAEADAIVLAEPSNDAVKAATRGYVEAGENYEGAKKNHDYAFGVVKDAANICDRANAKLSDAKSDDWQTVRTLADSLLQFVRSDDGRSIHEKIVAIVERHVTASIEELQKAADSAKDVYEARIRQCDGCAEVMQACQKTVDEARAWLDSRAENYADDDRVYRAHRVIKHKLEDDARKLRTYADEVARKRAGMQDSIARMKAEVIEKDAELNAMDAEGGNVDTAELVAHRSELEARIKALDDAIDAKGRWDVLDRELVQILADAALQRTMHDAADAILDAIKAVRETLIADLVKPLLVRMDRFMGAEGFRATCKLESATGKPIFDLGWTDGSHQYTVGLVKGGESTVCCAALAYAIVTLANPPLKLLLIEAGELDRAHLERLLESIRAVQDDIDNAIVTTHLAVAEAPPGWSLIHPKKE
ncbi:MAG: hypothetical protein ACKV2Q_36385 [Planctomycetaceae bacterium]